MHRLIHAGLTHATPALLLAAAIGLTGTAAAEEEPDTFTDVNEAARKTSNPLGGDFFIILNQWDNYFLDGDITSKTRQIHSWAIQPVIPIPMTDLIGENWIMVNRPTVPIVLSADIPDASSLSPGGGPPTIPPSGFPGGITFDEVEGIADLTSFHLLGQSLPTESAGGGDLVWGIGPTFQFPTASKDELGSGRYSIGPSAVGAFIGKKFIVGGLFQHWESYASGGKGADNRVSFSWLNLFYFWNLNDGWQVGGTPVITADWEAEGDDERWTLPLGLGVYNTSFWGGKLPMKVGVEMQYMPIRPDKFGQIFNIRLVVAPVLPSPFGTLRD